MQIRSALPLATRPVARPAAAAPTPAAPTAASTPRQIVAKNADASFGSDIFQAAIYGLTNLGQIVTLPSFLGGFVRALPLQALGAFNVGMGLFNGYKDIKGLKDAKNTRNWDNYIRLGADGALVAGGALILGGAMIAPALPLVGAGLAAAGFFARTVGVWNDESRL
jgi:hypothetical protein